MAELLSKSRKEKDNNEDNNKTHGVNLFLINKYFNKNFMHQVFVGIGKVMISSYLWIHMCASVWTYTTEQIASEKTMH